MIKREMGTFLGKRRFDDVLIGKGKLDIGFLEKSCDGGVYREMFEKWI